MTRRTYRGKTADHMAGRLAWFDGQCWVCDRPIHQLSSQVVLRRGEWIHTTCASGASDE
ncbi:hypothetical protein [Nocardioides sp. YIM 152315]|uniref:hypothetical protein n=1 Tax=Nocardioides sp. YIM 152315 TaxID=3031760 RepID=UPI0023D994C0|nr:hypothetical protein [Nocardioides sp. YIM 152315]MDF1603363.1 hypothetical protein [Nocardioides sp. YIM 152315]